MSTRFDFLDFPGDGSIAASELHNSMSRLDNGMSATLDSVHPQSVGIAAEPELVPSR